MPVVAGPLEAEDAVAPSPDVPDWVNYRGGDVRAFDRSNSREVFGPAHPFHKTTDILLTNGRLWFWVGNRGLAPFVNVYTLGSGSWRQAGYLYFTDMSDDFPLLGARLHRLTPDSGTVVLDVANRGPVYLTLQRGERFIRVQNGTSLAPTVSATRYCKWSGMPPSTSVPDQPVTGKFGNGLRQTDADTIAQILWPPEADKSRWTIAGWWLPTAASTTQVTSGIVSVFDTGSVHAVDAGFDTADDKIHATIGTTTLHGNAITFTAGQPIFWALRLSPEDGIALSVKPPSASIAHTKNNSIDPGSVLSYDYLTYSGHGVGTWGVGTWGVGTWGASITGKGTVDNTMIFDQYLDDSVIEALAAASSGLVGLAGLEGSLVTYVPYDIDPVMTSPTAANGKTVDASAGTDGLRRFVTALTNTVSQSGFGLSATSTAIDYAAGTLSNGSGDAIADMQAELSASFEQQVRVR